MIERTLREKATQVLAVFRARGLKVATAESCTGGLVAGALTDIAGSSDVFERGFVVYSNEAKTELLGVPAALIDRHGAVSDVVAAAMAEGALAHSHADLAVSVTGIAGPGGGSEQKPVGTVCIAVDDGESRVRTFRFPGGREMVKAMSANWAIDMLRRALIKS